MSDPTDQVRNRLARRGSEAPADKTGEFRRAAAERRDAIVEFVEWYTAQEGRAPSLREIADAVGMVSFSSVRWCLQVLEKEGRLVYPGGGKRRTVRIATRADQLRLAARVAQRE